MTPGALLLAFVVSALVVVAGGTALARSGDVIAARTQLGGVWVGSVFLALSTSLPEISTDIAAVRQGTPDLAAGDLFGSSLANMLILALVSLAPAGRELFRRAALDHILYAALAIVLTCIAAISILARPLATLGGIGLGSLALLAAYAVGSRTAFRHTTVTREAATTIEMSEGALAEESDAAAAPSLRRAVLTFIGASLVILLAAPRFARSAAGIAELTGLGTTFVGTWLVGFSTSLPELVTSLAAVRLGAYDLAVGNLFGSNALNMTIFVILDLVPGQGPVLEAVSATHILSALVVCILMGVAIAALVFRAKRRFALLEPSSALIIIGYILGLALILRRSVGQ